MKQLVCEMCAGKELIKQDGVFVCQNCGTKYSVEEAKKMMIEGTVKIDTTEQSENYLKLARHYRQVNNSEQAAKYYDLVLQEDPESWEAIFFSAYFQAIQSRVYNLESNIDILQKSYVRALCLATEKIDENPEDEEKSLSATESMLRYFNVFLESAYDTCMKGYLDSWPNVTTSYTHEHNSRCLKIINTLKILGREIDKIGTTLFITEKFDPLSVIPRKKGLELLAKWEEDTLSGMTFAKQGVILKNIGSSYGMADEIYAIRKYEPTYMPPLTILRFMEGKTTANIGDSSTVGSSDNSTTSGGCYVATAVYGSYDCPQVWTLRRYRDYTLGRTWYGRTFVRLYYTISPSLVKWFGHTDWFKKMWKKKLDNMVANLQMKGIESTPYEDKKW